MTAAGGASPGGTDVWAGRLGDGGLSEDAAPRVAGSLAQAAQCLQDRTGKSPDFAFFVPGRIEVMGKHTDYAGGRSLLTAVEWGFGFVGHRDPGSDGLRVLDARHGEALHLPLQPSAGAGVRGWGVYPSTVIRRLARDVPGLSGGAAVAFASDLPAASGMSSSSALLVGTFLALTAGLGGEARDRISEALGGWDDPAVHGDLADREHLAACLAAVEAGRPFGTSSGSGPSSPRGVGTDGGSEDHTAILCARADRLVQYSFLPTRFEKAAPLPAGWTFALAASGRRAEKAEGSRVAYNRLAHEARGAAQVWRQETGGSEPHLGAILASSPEARARLEAMLLRGGHTHLLARLRQFATESTELVPGAAASLATGDMDAFGRLAARSQALAEEVLGNQVPETSHLVASARKLSAPAASAFGAGFGGAVWALVPAAEVRSFVGEWRSEYVKRFPERQGTCAFLSSRPGPAAFRVV